MTLNNAAMELNIKPFFDALRQVLEAADQSAMKGSAYVSGQDVSHQIRFLERKVHLPDVDSYEKLFGLYDFDPALATDKLIPLRALRHLTTWPEQVIKGDLHLEGEAAIHVLGHSLQVHGNLFYKGEVFIAGDLLVTGRIVARSSWPGLYVAGNITARAINQVVEKADALIAWGDVRAKDMICSAHIEALGEVESRLCVTPIDHWTVSTPARFQSRLTLDCWFEPLQGEALAMASQLHPALQPPPLNLCELVERIEQGIDSGMAVWRDDDPL